MWYYLRVDINQKGVKALKGKTDNMWQTQPRNKNLFAQKFEEPLSKKALSVRLPVSAMEILAKMPSSERVDFVRNTLCKAIASTVQPEKYPTGGGAGTVIR